ncbi:TonB-dependent receptor [Pseudidiomarina sp. 1APP75-27a]|uniref:TonB-dependent receptor n=1 Tax=Pseudidiomarina terrestris TaxID=2820060 RepID=UPI002B0592E9|nr:TonB-dependent receptor [Pseudidiomarina sp. 1APP75-27a]MEA3588124.1 TonB-dependent receptor [Pseudidiomarina sp. 1APP75-27a]
MNNKIKYLTRSIRMLVYGMSVVSVSAMAQQAQESTNQETAEESVEVIEVTSSRRVQTIQDVPASVFAADPDDFLERGMTSLADMVETAPGFSFQSFTGQQGRGSIAARGVSQQNDTAVTAIYVDDVPLTSNSSFAAGGRLYFDGLLGDVQRVELIKGPQGTLFGATAMAGAVRYISNVPELFDSRGKFTADVSHTENGDINQVYRGFYSFPIVEGKVGLTLSGFTMDHGGYVDQVNPATGNVVRENANESDAHGYSADLYINATEDLDIRIKAMEQESSFGLSSAVRIASLDKEEAYGELKSDNAFGEDNLTHTLLSASFSYTLDGAVVDFTSSKAKYDSFNGQDVVNLYGPLIEMLGGFDSGSVEEAPLTRAVESDKTVHELRITSTTEGDWEWLGGLFYTDESTNNAQRLVGLPQDFLALDAGFPSEYEELAAFGNLTYYVTPDFDLTAGARFSQTEQSLTFTTDGPLAGGASVQQLETADESVTTYLFAARYRPSADTSWYARVASGYRPASSNLPVFDPFTNEQLSQPIVEQDDLWSYEVGIKGSLLDDRFNYESALYYIDWDNFQTVVTFFGVTTGGNAKSGITSKGWEGSFDYQLTNNFGFRGSAAFSDSTLNEDEPLLFGEAGAQVIRVPEWTYNAAAFYDYQLNSNVAGWVTLSARFKDEMSTAYDNGDPSNTSVNLKSEEYTTVNFTTGLEWQNWTASFYVNNLFDNDAYTYFNANAVPGTSIVDITGIPLEPRKVGVSVSYAF